MTASSHHPTLALLLALVGLQACGETGDPSDPTEGGDDSGGTTPSGGSNGETTGGAGGSLEEASGGKSAGGSPTHSGGTPATDSGGAKNSGGSLDAETGGTASGGAGSGSTGGEGGSGGKSGTGGAPPTSEVGVSCGETFCDPGERCVACWVESTRSDLCVPRPDLDQEGFLAATEDCVDFTADWGWDCEGPEHCFEGEFCSGTDNQCSSTPHAPPINCCFTCGAEPACDYCRADTDCPPGGYCNFEVLLLTDDPTLGACLSSE